jgi:hypothetical protein
MRRVLAILLMLLAPPLAAQDTDILIVESVDEPAEVEPAQAEAEGLRILSAEGLDLAEFLWVARIVAVLADTPNDPAFLQQMRYIEAAAERMVERDVVVITDTAPRGNSPLRRQLRPRGFMLAIIEKDGAIAQRRPAPRDGREIAAMIDRTPLRRQEMLERMPATR